MENYEYTAKDAKKRKKSGIVKATSKKAAALALRKMKLTSISVKLNLEKHEAVLRETPILKYFIYKDFEGNVQFDLSSQQPSTKDVIIFTKQLATMVESGLPLLQALNIVIKQLSSKAMVRAISSSIKDIESGTTLSDAFANHEGIFDNLYISMLKAGEKSGQLDSILHKLVTYMERADKLKSQVKSALTYPIGVLVLSILVVTGLLVYVIPTFAEQFSSAGKELPELTQVVIDFSNFFGKYWKHIFGSIAAIFISLAYWRQTPKGKSAIDNILLKLPVFGNIFTKIALGRFSSTLSSMISSGVNLLEALTICASSSGNKIIEDFILHSKTTVENGEKLSIALTKDGLIPEMVISMVTIGESTGTLDKMLEKVSDYYEEEIDIAIKSMIVLIEPTMIVVLGGIIGFIVVAMYLPVFEMASNIQ